MRRATSIAIASVLLSLAGGTAFADRRAYGVTYEAVTAAKGELDVEIWSTYAPEGHVVNGPASEGLRETIEIEYGITDRWDIALYNMLDITSGESESGYAGFMIETRYRLSDRGQWAIDPVLYLEFQQLFRGDANQKYEAKLILGKDFGPMNVSFNVAIEEERLKEASWHPEVEYALGASYAISPALVVGGEVFGKLEKEMDEIESLNWIGPAISWATSGKGSMRGLWVTLAGGAGLGGESDPWYGRAIIGLQF
jgi:hypothetical protein